MQQCANLACPYCDCPGTLSKRGGSYTRGVCCNGLDNSEHSEWFTCSKCGKSVERKWVWELKRKSNVRLCGVCGKTIGGYVFFAPGENKIEICGSCADNYMQPG